MTAKISEPISVIEDATMTPLMDAAFNALGGAKRWTGRVRGLAGLIRRTFVIDSTGHLENGHLKFNETLTFDDGETSQREWRIFERPDGLHIESSTVELIRPGLLEDGILSFVYRLKLGRFSLPYHDIFRPGADGETANIGFATFLGLRVMNIEAVGQRPR